MAEADPVRRLVAVAAETRRRKLRHRPSLGSLFRLGPLTQLVLMLIVRQHVNVTTASIPASRRPLYLAGARLLELYPLLNLLGNQVLGIGSIAYAGHSNITILADRDSFPDLELLVAGMRADLDRLTAGLDSAAEEVAPAAGTGRSRPHAGSFAPGG
jgi:diacylglycerol O-acyltransferase